MRNEMVDQLLMQWEGILSTTKTCVDERIDQFGDGRETRIKRTEGGPVIFDFKNAVKQKKMQERLCEEMPQLADLINSEPATEGYKWKVGDYVELYLRHYELVIKKIRENMEETDD